MMSWIFYCLFDDATTWSSLKFKLPENLVEIFKSCILEQETNCFAELSNIRSCFPVAKMWCQCFWSTNETSYTERWAYFHSLQLDRKTLSVAIRFLKAKTPEQRAAVDLDTHYSYEYLEEYVDSKKRREILYQVTCFPSKHCISHALIVACYFRLTAVWSKCSYPL